MTNKIKEAFQLVKKDISSIHKRIEKTDKSKIILEQELQTIKQKLTIEGELRDELGELLKKYDEMKHIKQELEQKITTITTAYERELQDLKQRFDEQENYLAEGLTLLSSTVQEALLRVEKQQQIEAQLLKKQVQKEKKNQQKQRKSLFHRLIKKISDDEE